MRYYEIIISDPKTGNILVPDPKTRKFVPTKPAAGVSTYASHVNKTFIPGALDIEVDIQVMPYAEAFTGSCVRIWGISLAEISQQSDLYGKDILVYAGLLPGLPLANLKQAGLIGSGTIWQAYGNWQGTEQTLDLIFSAAVGSDLDPRNITFNYPKGTPMGVALENTLKTAYPKPRYEVVVDVDKNLVVPGDQPGAYRSLVEFSRYIKRLSQSQKVGDPQYSGVNIIIRQGLVYARDTSFIKDPVQLMGQDFIGQPTWYQGAAINMSLMMRYDIFPGDFVKMPPKLLQPYVLTAPGAAVTGSPAADPKNSPAFSGVFQVTSVHHFGRYRQSDANSWVTVVNAGSITKDQAKAIAKLSRG